MSGKMFETGSLLRHSRKGVLGALAVAGLCMMRPVAASGQVEIESFENTLDGWNFNPTYNSQQYVSTFSTTTGVTNGSYALQMNSGATARVLNGFDYGNLLVSPRTPLLAAELAVATSLSVDYFAPSGALGYGPQIDLDIDDGGLVPGGTGYTSLDGFSYPTPATGVEVTVTYPISAAVRSELLLDAASLTGEDIVLQVGSGTPAGVNLPVLYVDNIQTQVPEPASLSLLALGAGSLLIRRRKA
jgi:hypothetical protein